MDLTPSWPSSSLDEDTAAASFAQVQRDHDEGKGSLTETVLRNRTLTRHRLLKFDVGLNFH